VLVVRDQAAAIVRRQHFSRLEVLPGKRGLSAAGRSDQDNERQLGHDELHRVNTPICVGAPTSGSPSPTGRNRTEYPNRSAIPLAQAWNCSRVDSKRCSRWRTRPAGHVSDLITCSVWLVVFSSLVGVAIS